MRRTTWFWLGAISLSGLALRLVGIGHEPLWLDEAWSLAFARESLLSSITAEISHPPAFRALLHVVIRVLGESEVALRLPSLVLGTLAIPLVFLTARRLVSRPAAWWATALFAFSPYEVWFSREARNYALFLLLTLLATWLLLRYLERPGPRRGAAYVVAAALGLLTHYFFFFVMAGHKFHALARGRKATTAWALPALLAALLFLPWVVHLVRNWEPQERAWMMHPARATGDAFYRMSAGYGLKVMHQEASPDARGGTWESSLPARVVPPLLMLILCVLGIRGVFRDGAGVLVSVTLLLPPATLLAVHAAGGPSLAADRTYIFASPFLYILAARGIVSIPRARVRAVAAGALLLVFAVSLASTDLNPRVGKEEWDSVGRWLTEQAGEEDVVLVHKPYLAAPVEYYFRGRTPVMRLGSPGPVELARIIERWNAPRVFLVLGHTDWDTGEKWPDLLEKAFVREEERLFPKAWGIRGYVFVPR